MILETLLRRMATEEKGPMTRPEPGTYTLSRELQPWAIGPNCESFVPNCLLYWSHMCRYPATASDLRLEAGTVWCGGSYTCLHRTSYKHGKTEAVSIVHQRFAGSRYMLVTRWANYHHITQYKPQGVGPKWLLDSGTPATSTKGDEERRIHGWDRWLVVDAPRKSVCPGFEPGHWSFFPCRHSSEQCF